MKLDRESLESQLKASFNKNTELSVSESKLVLTASLTPQLLTTNSLT